MTLTEELRAGELPGDRQYMREARATLGALLRRAADRIEALEIKRDALATRVAVLEGQGEPVGWMHPEPALTAEKMAAACKFMSNAKVVGEAELIIQALVARIRRIVQVNERAHPTPEALARTEREAVELRAFVEDSVEILKVLIEDRESVTGEECDISRDLLARASALSPSPATQLGEGQ